MEPTLPFDKPLNNPPKAVDEVSKEVHRRARALARAPAHARPEGALLLRRAARRVLRPRPSCSSGCSGTSRQLTVNQVRPRLTELVKADLVRKAGRRACKSKSAREQGSKVAPNTFAVTQRGRLVLKEAK
jgi:hypothetical protein